MSHVCAWCPNARALTAFYHAFGREVTHGMCDRCGLRFISGKVCD